MYYLTRIELDPYKKLTQLALKNANMIHGTIEKVFGNEAERKLWRIDSLRGRRYLMIVSRTLPDFTPLLAQFAPDGAKSQSKSYDAFLESIKDGSQPEREAVPALKAGGTDGVAYKEGKSPRIHGKSGTHPDHGYRPVQAFKRRRRRPLRIPNPESNI